MISKVVDGSQTQIVLYQGDFIRNEINKFKSKLFSCMFDLELFFYPSQQKYLKNQVKLLISYDSFSFKVFCTIFPKVTEIYRPKDKLGLMFKLFGKFAENPSDGICGRFFWSSYNGIYPDKFKEQNCFLDVSRCGVTSEALLTTIFGIEKSRNLQRLEFDSNSESALYEVWQVVEKNSKYLQRLKDYNFFAYSFGLNSVGSFPGHAFLVVQYLDKRGDIQYRIFQSYIREFCLKRFLNDGASILNHGEFYLLLENLEKFIISDTWTGTLEGNYQRHFNVEKGFIIGSINPCKGTSLVVEWGGAGINDVNKQNKKFESFKRSTEFPDIEATCCCCSESQRKLERLTTEEFQKLDKKLFDLYERHALKIGCEHIQVDLDSLDLDLTEEGGIEVPERDEYGYLVMDGREPMWIERTITLRKVTENVIAEINKLILENTFNNSVEDSSVVLLNTNREPFVSYNMLGLPDDQFFISEDEKEKLWLRRIINALVEKGHVAKLDRVNGHGYFIQI